MRQEVTYTSEDYLKTIYNITRVNERASTNQIADALQLAPASVTGMIKKLSESDPPLVEYQSHRGVMLTMAGERVALEVIRHHRLIEMYLLKVLGFDWDKVHEEADRLEHVISEDFEEKIAIALGEPTRDPHGDPIPDRYLSMPETNNLPLSDLRPGQTATIIQMQDDNPALLRYLQTVGILPDTRIRILDYSPFDGNLSIQVQEDSEKIVLGPAITQKVFVANSSIMTLAGST